MSSLVVATLEPTNALSTDLVDLKGDAEAFAANARAANTTKAYRGDITRFKTWCDLQGLQPLPATPASVALYITHLANQGRTIATIGRALVAISELHRAAGEPSPCRHDGVRTVRQGIARTIGRAPKKKTAFPLDALRAFARSCPETLTGLRDRALVLLGFAGAFRRSELVGLDVADVAFCSFGATVILRRSKTDQEGLGVAVGIPTGQDPTCCPVQALRAWLEASNQVDGPLFRGVDRHGHVSAERLCDRTVARIVKAACVATGLDPTTYAGHSLRSGFATAAIQAGKTETSTMRQTRHKSVPIFRGYVRAATVFQDNAASFL